MAWESPLQLASPVAGEDLSAKQYYAVKISSTGVVSLSGAGENAIGILQNSPQEGEVASVMLLGISKAVYGASVTAGQNLAVDANGKLVPAAGNAAVVAIAWDGGSANEIHTVLLATRVTQGARTNSVLSIPIKLSGITTDGDVVTEYVPGFPGKIQKVAFVVTEKVTTADKAATLNLEIGTTNLTGGLIALTSANCAALGAVIDGTEITDDNVFSATDAISVEASSVTAFAEGAGVLLITLA